jgi:hypothetical protein
MARKAAEASKAKAQQIETPPSPYRWVRFALEAILVIGLAFVIFRFVRPGATTLTSTPVPFNPDIPAGRVRFDDFSGVTPMDQITLSLNNVEFPSDGTHYEGWLISNDDTITRKIGTIILNDAGVGQVLLTDPDQQSFFQNFDHVIITQESDGTETNQPTGKIVYSSIYPPQALIPARKLLAYYENVPDNLALIQGLWYYSGYYVTISISGDKDTKTIGLVEAFNDGDEATVRARTEEIINQIVGNQSDQFMDYNNDDNIDNTPGEDIPTDGFGSFSNGNQNGYVQETALQAKLASDAIDSSPNIRTNGEKLQICIQNMDGRLHLILQSALKLNETPFGPEMEPIVADLEILGNNLLNGNDTNGNGLVEAITGECGANDAYTFAYLMADMLLYPGEDRVPPTGK